LPRIASIILSIPFGMHHFIMSVYKYKKIIRETENKE